MPIPHTRRSNAKHGMFFLGPKVLARWKAMPPMDRSILQGTCRANADKSRTFVPGFYRSKAHKIPRGHLLPFSGARAPGIARDVQKSEVFSGPISGAWASSIARDAKTLEAFLAPIFVALRRILVPQPLGL